MKPASFAKRHNLFNFTLAAGLFFSAFGSIGGAGAAQPARLLPAPGTAMPMEETGRTSDDSVVATGEWRRQMIDFRTREAPGTIIIDTSEKFLYLVEADGKAMRYGIGVGREGFQWAGQVRVTRKAEWPDWIPPAEMIGRQPYLPRFMAGGPGNPLGARAMYLGSTIYRIHGTNQPETIGANVSSGCFRLANGDVIDLFSRVSVGAKVVILNPGAHAMTASLR